VTPALFVLASAAIVVNAMFTTPGRAAVGLVVVATGVPAYFFWRRNLVAPLTTPRTRFDTDHV
jgi:APA family basic amino acid/polyamine antiporter